MPAIYLRMQKKATAIELIVTYTINSDTGSILYFDNPSAIFSKFHKTAKNLSKAIRSFSFNTPCWPHHYLNALQGGQLLLITFRPSVEIVEISTPRNQSSWQILQTKY